MIRRRQNLMHKLKKFFYHIPSSAFDSHFEVKIANCKSELEAAFFLLSSKPRQLKCSIYTFLPQTVTIVVKYKGRVVGAMVLVKDSSLGLPSDLFYSDENSYLRKKGDQLVEIANLGVETDFRGKNESIQLLLMKYAFQFIKKFSYGNQLLMLVRPQSEEFYTKLWDFYRIGDLIKYKSSQQSSTVLLAWTVGRQSQKNWLKPARSFRSLKKRTAFLQTRDSRLSFPVLKEGQTITPVMTPELLEYFFVTKTSVYEELNLSTRKLFLEIFLQFFGEEKIQGFLNIEREYQLKEFRAPTSTEVTIQAHSTKYTGKIIDISTQGCFIELDEKFRSPQEDLTLSFRLGDQNLSVTGKALWRNENQLIRYPTGYGIKFDNPKQEIRNELQSWIKAG